jgi:hypothetical protein
MQDSCSKEAPFNCDILDGQAQKALRHFSASRYFPLTELEAEPFSLPGVYALYYRGFHAAYEAWATYFPDQPLYVGKSTNSVKARLRNHLKSLSNVANLDASDFVFRRLHLSNGVWSESMEAYLIGLYQPPWNGLVKGFGNNDQGVARRDTTRISDWDHLHPGRDRATSRDGAKELAEVQMRVACAAEALRQRLKRLDVPEMEFILAHTSWRPSVGQQPAVPVQATLLGLE